MENDDSLDRRDPPDPPPAKKARTKLHQAGLGKFGFTKNTQPAAPLALNPEEESAPKELLVLISINSSIFPCSFDKLRFCGKSLQSKTALRSHEIYCERRQMKVSEEQDTAKFVEEIRSLFDFKSWARGFVASKHVADPEGVILDLDSSSSDRENDAMDIDAEIDAMDIDAEIPPFALGKPVVRRWRLSLREKIRMLDMFPEIMKLYHAYRVRHNLEGTIYNIDIYKIISVASGRTYGGISKIFSEEEALREKYKSKFNRKRFTFGSGRKPSFPKTESTLAELIRKKRLAHFTVSKFWVMEEYRKLAKQENADLFAKLKVDVDIFLAFLKRNELAFRRPSNVKPMSLEESQKSVRGWFRWLKELLDGTIEVEIGEATVIDPILGRFPFDCRINVDEVAGYLGDPGMNIISVKGEKHTKILVPDGWGDRICTLIVVVTPLKLIPHLGIVFRGTGKRLSAKELDFYKTLANVEIFFQAKAWVNTAIELEFVSRILVPYVEEVKQSYKDSGKPFPGILDVEDNFSAHMTSYIPSRTF